MQSKKLYLWRLVAESKVGNFLVATNKHSNIANFFQKDDC